MTEFCGFPFGKGWVVCIGAIYLNLRSRQYGRIVFFWSCDFHRMLIDGISLQKPFSFAYPEAEGENF